MEPHSSYNLLFWLWIFVSARLRVAVIYVPMLV